MALPADNKAPKVDALQAEIDKMGPKKIAGLPDLDEGDFKVIGMLIQEFCFMDFNLRRALEVFHAAKMLPKEYQKQYPNLPDAKLTEALTAILKEMDPKTEDIETALVWIKVIDTTRKQRNLAGHFAAKRFPGHDVYVFGSKSDKDARKVLGFGLAENQAHFVVAGRTEFAEMTFSARNAQEWLAKKVPEWHGRYSNQAKAC